MSLDPVQGISLLWPAGVDLAACQKRARCCDAWAVADLGLEELAQVISLDARHVEGVRQVLFNLCDDPAVITYRQEVVADLLELPELAAYFQTLLPKLNELARLSGPEWTGQTPLHQLTWRLGELELYVDCVRSLHAALDKPGEALQATGLRRLRELAARVAEDESFRALAEELPRLRAGFEQLRSITLGINLDSLLRPVEATILSLNHEKFTGPSFLGKLLGKKSETQGVTPLHSLVARRTFDGRGMFAAPGDDSLPLLTPLFKDLNDILIVTTRPLAEALDRYITVSARFLVELEPELAFYLGGVKLIQHLRGHGLPICRPEIAPQDERLCQARGLYNVNLALHLIGKQPDEARAVIVPNDVAFGPEGRIFILTGPNRGGKTTYTQAVGLLQVLAQAGLYVPGEQARLSPVDAVYTHFPAAENLSLETGRLGQEARRLAQIFDEATRHSLVLLNESLFSTSPGESLYLARDIVRGLRLLGARAIYATHLHELAAGVEALNAEVPGDSPVVSLVAEVETEAQAQPLTGAPDAGQERVRRTYKIRPGPPLGTSYAKEIASYYGISLEKLAQTLRRRGIIP